MRSPEDWAARDGAFYRPIWHVPSAHLLGFQAVGGGCRGNALLEQAAPLPGLLFLPLEALAEQGRPREAVRQLRSPDTLVLEIAEEGLPAAGSEHVGGWRWWRRQGVRLALVAGAGGAGGHRLPYGLKPAFVRLGAAVVRAWLDQGQTDLLAWVRWAHAMAARVIAEGVDSAGEAAQLAGVGVDYATGDGLGSPAPAKLWAKGWPQPPVGLAAAGSSSPAPAAATMARAGPAHPDAWGWLARLPVPAVVLDPSGRVAGFNALAEQLWEAPAGLQRGAAADRLAIYLSNGEGQLTAATSWLMSGEAAVGIATRQCWVADGEGDLRRCVVARAPVWVDGQRHTVVAVLGEREGVPGWATQDSLTGLWTRARWDQEGEFWQAWDGVLILMDVDGLKLVNDSYGHAVGDRVLRAAGEAVRETAGPAVACVRWGGDEMLLVWPGGEEASARRLAEAINRRLAELLAAAGLADGRVRLSYGIAAYEAGRIHQAIKAADAVLYESKGTVLPARAGRLILYQSGRLTLKAAHPTDPAAELASLLGPAFARFCCRRLGTMRWRAADLVAWAAPAAGSAALLVGLGYEGRILFEGGLAERIGAEGQLLVTEADLATLVQARQRVAQTGWDFVHFLPALPHDLPLAPRCAGWIICGEPLHLGNVRPIMAELARVLEAQGTVAVGLPLRWEWGAAWRPALRAVQEAVPALAQGFSFRWPFGLQGSAVTAVAAACGLKLEAYWQAADEVPFTHPEAEGAHWRESGLLPALLSGLGEADRRRVEEGFYRGLQLVGESGQTLDRLLTVHWRYLRFRLAEGSEAAPVA